ncbi:MAG: winged helix-turn-helix transcriptional regulator [Candidatus Hodarchaeales archaeon]|jgi:putative transcriptional regulator
MLGNGSKKTQERDRIEKIPFSRDIKVMTEVLILLELISNPRLKLKEIADKLDISKQAVSEYLKNSIDEKHHLEKDEGIYKLTYKGVNFLQSELLEAQDFFQEAMNKLSVFKNVTALAKTKIKKNEKLGLFMEEGVLTAYFGRESESTGISLHSANVNEEVRVGSLKGVVDHEIATIIMIKIPDRSKYCDFDILTDILDRHSDKKIATLDLVSTAIINKTKIHRDIIYAPIDASMEAVLKGVPVVVLGTDKSLKEVEEALNKYNSGSRKKIPFSVVNLITKT